MSLPALGPQASLLSHVAGKLALILPQVAQVVAAVANVLAKLAPIAAQLGAVLLDLVGPSGLPFAAELPPVPGQRAPVLPDVAVVLAELPPVLPDVLPFCLISRPFWAPATPMLRATAVATTAAVRGFIGLLHIEV
ncbi:MAG TPA: hypothetical protein VFD81_18010 [Methylomirabilota bacterium]|nr:hypothetical protein [Methylomirabilota bacterium]